MTQTDEIQKYVDIGIVVLKRFNTPLIFDVWIRRSATNYSKLFMKGDVIDWDRLEAYKSKGVESLCVALEDYDKYSLFVEKMGEQLAKNTEKFTADDAASLLREMVNFSMREIMVNGNVDERVVANSANVVNSCVQALQKDTKSMMKIMGLMGQHPYIFKHSITTSILSIILAQNAGVANTNNLSLLGLGAFLHDVGVSQLSFDPEDKDSLTAEERKEIMRHPELGKRLLDTVKGMRSEVLSVVLQHHEQPNGRGYPNGLKEGEIYPMAKIVAIADTFSALITKRAFRPSMSPLEALGVMRSDTGKFDKHLLEKFCKIFGG